MITLEQVIEFAAAVTEYRRTRCYSWRHHDEARRVVDGWTAIGGAMTLERPTSEAAQAVVVAIDKLMAETHSANMKRALKGALDEALIDLADSIAEIKPEADEPAAPPADGDEKAA